MRRVGVFGWGLVAPGAANIEEFAQALGNPTPRLSPFDGFGPTNFLVGNPKFDFADYSSWFDGRFPPARVKQLVDKMDATTLFAVGSFIQSLGQNQGIEQALRDLGPAAHVYVGNALGAYPTLYRTSVDLYRAQRRWNRYWCHPERNQALSEFERSGGEIPLVCPSTVSDPDERERAEDEWFAYWASRSDQLKEHLEDLRQIESISVEGEVEAGKMKVLRDKKRGLSQLKEKWNAPEPPWNQVSANVLWNIPNTPASQISMLGKITGSPLLPLLPAPPLASRSSWRSTPSIGATPSWWSLVRPTLLRTP